MPVRAVSVENPRSPAARGVRYAPVPRIYDAVLGSRARALPAEIPAPSGGQGCMVALALPDLEAGRRHVTVIEPMIGGGGRPPRRDGLAGRDAPPRLLQTTPGGTPPGQGPPLPIPRLPLGAHPRPPRRPARRP